MNSNKDTKDDLEKLLDKIDREISRRVKELNYLKSLLYYDNKQKDYIDTMMRSNILLLYSHWEGAIKNISIKYLKYVSKTCKNYDFMDIKTNFLSLAIINKTMIDNFSNIKEGSSFKMINNLVTTAIEMLNSKVLLKIDKDTIETKSNLNYETLENITLQLGINNPIKIEHEKLLDLKLVGSRNAIAHGQYENNINSINDFEEVYNFVIQGIDLFKDEIISSAQNKSYLKLQ